MNNRRFALLNIALATLGILGIIAAKASSPSTISMTVTSGNSGQVVLGARITYKVAYTIGSESTNIRVIADVPTTATLTSYDSGVTKVTGSDGVVQLYRDFLNKPGTTGSFSFTAQVKSDGTAKYGGTVTTSAPMKDNNTGKVFKRSKVVSVPVRILQPTDPVLSIGSISQTAIVLNWSASATSASPQTTIKEYDILDGGSLVATTLAKTFTHNVACGSNHNYLIRSVAVPVSPTFGADTATSRNVNLTNAKAAACPPAVPTVSITANDKTGTIAVIKDSALTLRWSTGNAPSSCRATGSWSGDKPASGSETRTSDTATPKLNTYTLSCTNVSGTGSASVKVSVLAPSGDPGAPPPPPDVKAPTTPGNFKATLATGGLAVQLNWDASSDNTGVQAYQIDRSVDQLNWETLSSTVTDASYQDSTTAFALHYFYRVLATDAAGNHSDFATADITTPDFSVSSDTIASDDGKFSVSIPANAIVDGVSCGIGLSQGEAPKTVGKKLVVAGPYELICKLASSEEVTEFLAPVIVTVKFSSDDLKRYNNFSLSQLDDENWVDQKATYDKKANTLTASLSKPGHIIVLGQKKVGLSANLIIGILLFLAAVGGVFVYLVRRAQKQKYDEYIRSRYYNL